MFNTRRSAATLKLQTKYDFDIFFLNIGNKITTIISAIDMFSRKNFTNDK